jgi:hypothetical protein
MVELDQKKYFEGLAYIGPEQSKYTPAEHKNSFGDRSSTRDLSFVPSRFLPAPDLSQKQILGATRAEWN